MPQIGLQPGKTLADARKAAENGGPVFAAASESHALAKMAEAQGRVGGIQSRLLREKIARRQSMADMSRAISEKLAMKGDLEALSKRVENIHPKRNSGNR
eukprot:COSAG05_NODE_7595_length_792_cov_0.966811_1_plen_99_part_01